MAIHRIPILGWQSSPDDSGNVWFAPLPVAATNDKWGGLVVVFADSATKDELHGRFTVPKNYVGSPKIIIVWSTSVTTGDVEWDTDIRAVGGNDLESLDQATAQESDNINDTAPSAAWERMECEVSLTAGNLAVDDEVEWILARDGTDGGDTMAASAYLFQLLFEYSDA